MFSLACVLPSPTSAVGPVTAGPSWFGWLMGTTTQSDSSPPCAPDVRLDAFSGRPAVLLSGDAEVSRFSCMKFLSVRGVYDYAGSATGSRYRLLRCGLPHTSTGSAPQTVFSKLNTRPTNASVYASKGTPRARSGARLSFTPFPVLTHCAHALGYYVTPLRGWSCGRIVVRCEELEKL